MNTTVKFKLNPIQQRWIDALRSGFFAQGQRLLHNAQDEMCCLGVGCKLARVAGVEIEISTRHAPGEDPFANAHKYNGELHYPPDALADWLGLHDNRGSFQGLDGCVLYLNGYASLTDANDSGATFEQIADLVEDNPVAIFKLSSLVPDQVTA